MNTGLTANLKNLENEPYFGKVRGSLEESGNFFNTHPI